MKPSFHRFFTTSIATVAAVSSSAWAVDRIKQNNLNNLSLGTSWDTLPTSSDIAVFDSTYATTGVLGTGGLFPVLGLRVTNPGGNVTINNGTAGAEVAIGASGIDMSSASVNLNIQRLRVDASQTWDIASGRVFNLGSSSGARGGVLSLGSGGPFTLTKTGTGSVQLDTSNTAIGNVNWDVQSGVIRAIWNGSSAWGTGAITLGGGGIATGTSFTGSVGNWTWNNNVTLTNATSSFIDNQNIAGSDRWVKLTGVISGAGNLEFRDTGTGFNNSNFGHILAGNNTNTGTVTIATNAEVRVGSTTGNDANTGNFGKLAADSALVVNNGTLSFSRLDAHTVANDISGSGALRVGLSATVGTATTTQVVTVSGTNTYTGATTVNNGRLNLTGSLTSNISVLAAGTISGIGSTTGTLSTVTGSGIFLTGGVTSTSLVANGVAIGGSTSVSFLTNPSAATHYDVFTYGAGGLTGFANLTAAWRGSFTDDTTNQKVTFLTGATALRTWATTSGTWDNTGTHTNWVEGDFKFYDGDDAVFGDIASSSTVTLGTNIAPGSVLVQNAANAYTFAGGALAGAAGLTKSNAGTLILTNTNTNTGATMMSGGVLDVGNGGASGALGSGAISVGAGAELIFNRSNNFTVSNSISGAGLVTKKGAGRMTVNGNSSAGVVNWNFTGTGNGDIGFQNANAVGGSGSTITLAENATGSAFFATNGNTSDAAISLASGSVFTWNGSTGNTTTLSGEISGAGAITKVSGETLRLTGVNTYTGTTTITTGTLELGESGQLGAGNYAGQIANSANFFVNSTANQTITGVISGGGALNKANTGTLGLSANNTHSGNTTISGGVLEILSNGLYRNSDGTGAFNNVAVVTINTGGTLRLKSYQYNGDGGLGGLRDYAGNRVINGGTLEVTGASHSSGQDFTVGTNGGTFRYNPAASGDTLTLTGNTNTNTQLNGTLTFDTLGHISVNDIIEGTGGITKTGAGTLTLTGANTYAGDTTVSAGTLVIDGSVSTGSLNVESGATLMGSGTIGGATTIDSGAAFSPGNSPGLLTIDSSLTLMGDTLMEIGGLALGLGYDSVDVAGLLTYGGDLSIVSYNAHDLAQAASYTLFGVAGGETGTFNSVAVGALILVGDNGVWSAEDGGITYTFTESTGTLVVIPEPRAAFLGGIGMLILLRRRRSA
jgi:autotransporter-associated beta strand protein